MPNQAPIDQRETHVSGAATAASAARESHARGFLAVRDPRVIQLAGLLTVTEDLVHHETGAVLGVTLARESHARGFLAVATLALVA